MIYWHILQFYGYFAVVNFLIFYNQCLKSLCPKSSRPTLGHTQPPIQWIAGFASPLPSRVERLGRQDDLSPPSSAEVRNEWSRKLLRGVCRDGCNFSLIGAMRLGQFISVISESLSPRHCASSGCGWRNGIQYGG